MVDRVNVERIVRKALEAALHGAKADLHAGVPLDLRQTDPYVGGGFPIWWPNLSFYDKKDEAKPPFYCRFTNHPSQPRTRTLGANPQTLMRGHCIIGCFVPQGAGEDAIDDLANPVMAAFPLHAVFSREGFDTYVESVDPKPPFGSLGRYYKPVHINWNCWRTTP